MMSSCSATVNLAPVLLRTSSTSIPGASSVKVSSPVSRLTWKTHYTPLAEIPESVRRDTYQVGDDRANNIGPSQRQTALLNNLRRTILGDMARRDDNLRLVWVRDQVHGTAHALEDLAGDHVVGQVAVGADLECLEGVSTSLMNLK